MKNSLIWVEIFFQPAKIHSGIKKVVSRTKNKEIPSKPSKKFTFKKENQSK